MEARFLKYVDKTDTCWNWTGGKDNDRYGHFSIDHKTFKAHRVAYELWKGQIAQGLLVRHICNNPVCVNPDHLETGTHQDNMNDRRLAERQAKGEKNGQSKLTEIQVQEIKRLLEIGLMTQLEIGNLFQVHKTLISKIKLGRSWSHL
jgi:hypothetical protein